MRLPLLTISWLEWNARRFAALTANKQQELCHQRFLLTSCAAGRRLDGDCIHDLVYSADGALVNDKPLDVVGLLTNRYKP